MRRISECRLYTFVDTGYLRGRDPVEIARQLCAGGADIVQLRAKDLGVEKVREMACRIGPVLEKEGVGFVINDYPQIALEVGADFCHLGQEDFFRPEGIWRTSFPVSRLGLSSHAPAQALRALAVGPAYIAVGPVFPTGTKPGVPAVTLEYVRWAAENVRIPWFAIGGITLENVESVISSGAKGICIVSAILAAEDVAAECRKFRSKLSNLY